MSKYDDLAQTIMAIATDLEAAPDGFPQWIAKREDRMPSNNVCVAFGALVAEATKAGMTPDEIGVWSAWIAAFANAHAHNHQ